LKMDSTRVRALLMCLQVTERKAHAGQLTQAGRDMHNGARTKPGTE
jgi:hypothetical protein